MAHGGTARGRRTGESHVYWLQGSGDAKGAKGVEVCPGAAQ